MSTTKKPPQIKQTPCQPYASHVRFVTQEKENPSNSSFQIPRSHNKHPFTTFAPNRASLHPLSFPIRLSPTSHPLRSSDVALFGHRLSSSLSSISRTSTLQKRQASMDLGSNFIKTEQRTLLLRPVCLCLDGRTRGCGSPMVRPGVK